MCSVCSVVQCKTVFVLVVSFGSARKSNPFSARARRRGSGSASAAPQSLGTCLWPSHLLSLATSLARSLARSPSLSLALSRSRSLALSKCLSHTHAYKVRLLPKGSSVPLPPLSHARLHPPDFTLSASQRSDDLHFECFVSEMALQVVARLDHQGDLQDACQCACVREAVCVRVRQGERECAGVLFAGRCTHGESRDMPATGPLRHPPCRSP